jgi:hypothetical protein
MTIDLFLLYTSSAALNKYVNIQLSVHNGFLE